MPEVRFFEKLSSGNVLHRDLSCEAFILCSHSAAFSLWATCSLVLRSCQCGEAMSAQGLWTGCCSHRSPSQSLYLNLCVYAAGRKGEPGRDVYSHPAQFPHLWEGTSVCRCSRFSYKMLGNLHITRTYPATYLLTLKKKSFYLI